MRFKLERFISFFIFSFIDFWPNNGINQPGCSSPDPIDSHGETRLVNLKIYCVISYQY